MSLPYPSPTSPPAPQADLPPAPAETGRKGLLDNMAPNIALIILFAYVTLLFMLTIISCVRTDDKQWIELTKTGFTTLGSALTLILGYYFGQKQVVDEARRENQKTTDQLGEEQKKKSQLLDIITANPTPNESDDLSKLDESRLQSGRPAGAGPRGPTTPPSSTSSSSSSSSSAS